MFIKWCYLGRLTSDSTQRYRRAFSFAVKWKQSSPHGWLLRSSHATTRRLQWFTPQSQLSTNAIRSDLWSTSFAVHPLAQQPTLCSAPSNGTPGRYGVCTSDIGNIYRSHLTPCSKQPSYSGSGHHHHQHHQHPRYHLTFGERLRRFFGLAPRGPFKYRHNRGTWGFMGYSRKPRYTDAYTGAEVDRKGRYVYRV